MWVGGRRGPTAQGGFASKRVNVEDVEWMGGVRRGWRVGCAEGWMAGGTRGGSGRWKNTWNEDCTGEWMEGRMQVGRMKIKLLLFIAQMLNAHDARWPLAQPRYQLLPSSHPQTSSSSSFSHVPTPNCWLLPPKAHTPPPNPSLLTSLSAAQLSSQIRCDTPEHAIVLEPLQS